MMTTCTYNAFPAELRARRQWVLWRGTDRREKTGAVKLNKVPYDPKTNPLRKASSTDDTTWGAYEQCLAALPVALEQWRQEDPAAFRGGGLGYVFSAADPFCGLDLDHVRDPNTGILKPWAAQLLQVFDSYTEISPTRSGLHTILLGTLPEKGFEKSGYFGLYDRGRFFTVTGEVWKTPSPVVEHQASVTALYAVKNILIQALQHHEKFEALFAGQWTPYPSQSEAELAFCNILARCGGTAEQLDACMRLSGLFREKWERQDYRAATIAKALDGKQPGQAWHDADQRQNGHAPPGADSQDPTPTAPLPWSDYTNALAMVAEHGQNLRYCYPWKSWLVWTGTHWERDADGTVMRAAKATIKRMAARAATIDDDHALKAFLAHIKASLATAKLKAMVECAQSEAGIAVQPEALDAHPWLLNCTNGTLDLHTGTLSPHRREDLLTKCLPVAYDPQATCPTWEAFLWRIMGGTAQQDNPDESAATLDARVKADDTAQRLITFLQRAIGYSLTGSTQEQCLFLLHGSGSNGKSTLLTTVLALLGSYAKQAEFSTFLARQQDTNIRNDLATLRGARLVSAIEVAEGKRLAETLVKQVTGQDVLTARFLFQEFFEFKPQFKLFLAANHKPVIRGTDHAIWRRIRLIPFNVTIPDAEQDKSLDTKLQAELPGILAWAVRGCLGWQRDGLSTPEEVLSATAGYRSEMDTVGAFIEECCVVKDYANIRASKLYEAYQNWCKSTGEEALNQRNFGMRLTERGLERKRSTGHWWHGIDLTPKSNEKDDDKDDESDVKF